METISSNQFSHDMQVSDALAFLRIHHTEDYCNIRKEFTEELIFDGSSYIDHETMGVDVEWIHWLTDAIESTAKVFWQDGEPFTDSDDS